MHQFFSNKYPLIGGAGDLLLANFSILLTFSLHDHNVAMRVFEQRWPALVMVSTILLILFDFFGLFRTNDKLWSEVMASLFVSIILQAGLLSIFAGLFKLHYFPLHSLLTLILFQLLSLSAWRWYMMRLQRRFTVPRNIIIIAPVNEGLSIASKIKNKIDRIIGIVSEQPLHGEAIPALQSLGTYSQLAAICAKYRPDLLVVSGNIAEKYKRLALELSMKHGGSILLIPSLYEILLTRHKQEQLQDTLVFKVGFETHPCRELYKRIIDCIMGGVAFLAAIPIMMLIAAAIKLDSAGPVLFRQERVSKNGKVFMLYKLRTMVVNAENLTGPVLAVEKDPRITRVGRFLRMTRLDELPQLINVIKGEMSIVGPRPERPYFVSQFEKNIPEYAYRHRIKPGLTGLAQVTGKYSTAVEDKLRYDLLYLKAVSPLFDFQIILQTVKVLLLKGKAS
jgi:exopolysaccharide biosynthesis polyprenyl glycosylphosphotransferase